MWTLSEDTAGTSGPRVLSLQVELILPPRVSTILNFDNYFLSHFPDFAILYS